MGTYNQCIPQQGIPFVVLPDLRLCALSLFPGQSPAHEAMGVCRKTPHVCPDYGNDRLSAGIPDTGDVLYHTGSFLLRRLHEVIYVIVQLFDVDIQLIQMVEKYPHHFPLKFRHDPVQVVYDLFLRCFQVVRYDLLFVQDVIFGGINLPACQDVFQDVPRAFAVDVRNCSGNSSIF